MVEVFDLGRGTTPYAEIKVDGVDLSSIDVMWLTFKQGSLEITKTLDDVTIDSDTITVHFTQEETLKFSSRSRVSIQMRFLIGTEANKSNVVTVEVSDILKDGVIS